jgi:hypothetical protein
MLQKFDQSVVEGPFPLSDESQMSKERSSEMTLLEWEILMRWEILFLTDV